VVGAVVVLGLIMLAGGLAVQAVTDDGELAARGGERAPAGTSGQAELSHQDESFSIEANANRGLVRITEADGRTYELSLDAELIRDAAERWPQAASEWRRAFLSDILPAMAEARANRDRGPPVTGDGAPAVPRVPEIPEIPEIAYEWMGEAPRPAGPWLLVDQLGAAVSDEDRARVDRKLASPAFGPVEWITADEEPGLDLVSRAIATIGIGTPSDPETRTRLRRLLGELEQVEGLVWLYEADGPRALAIASEATAERGMRRALRDAR